MHVIRYRTLAVAAALLIVLIVPSCLVTDMNETEPVGIMNDTVHQVELATDNPIWNYTYDVEGNNVNNRGYSIAETSDGGFVVAGDVSNANLDFWVIRVDANGTEVWNTTIDNGSLERAWDVVEVSSGGYAACGYVRISSTNYLYLVRFDVDGNVLWMRNYTGNSDQEARALAETDDGGFILVGQDISFGGTYIVKTDSDGYVDWETTISEGSSYLAGRDVIDLAGTSGYVVACQIDNSGNDDMYLMRLDNSGNQLWNTTHGGSGTEYCFGMTNSSDGYTLCGTTSSWGAGGYDMYLVKFDLSGNFLWNQTYGDSGNEMCQSVTSTADGGYALAGYAPGNGEDIWLVRTDSEGEVWWTELIHHSGNERPDKIVEVHDGGYAMSGYVDPTVGDWDMIIYRLSEPRWDSAPTNHEIVFDAHLYQDIDATSTDAPIEWSINDTDYFSIDSLGVLQNSTTLPVDHFGLEIKVTDSHDHWIQKEIEVSVRLGSGNIIFDDGQRVTGRALVQSPDGDFVTVSTSDPVIFGNVKPWIVKYNITGHQVWDQDFSSGYYLQDIVACSSGGYVAVGVATDIVETDDEFWLLKIDEDGQYVWDNTFRRSDYDEAESLVETPDGGFLMLGHTHESPGGALDFWVVRTDSGGNHLWNKTYGYPTENEEGYSIIACSDGGYALAGYTTQTSPGNNAAWLVRIDESGNQLWNRTYGGSHMRAAVDIIEMSGGGFALTGEVTPTSGSDTDAFVLKTDSNGYHEWNYTYGGSNNDQGEGLVQITNGSIVVVGRTFSFSGSNNDGYFLLLDSSGNVVTNKSIGSPVDTEYFEDVALDSAGGVAMIGRHRPQESLSGNGWFVHKPMLKWTQEPTDQTVELDTDVSFQFKASSPVRVMHWWVSNTVDFSISRQGLLSNKTALSVDDYLLTIRVFDHLHNVLQKTITISVVDSTGPSWVVAPTNQEIDFGEGLSVQFEAYDISGISGWTVSDTTNFTITQDGLLTNATPLDAGVYDIIVNVTDNYDNPTLESITVTVVDDIAPEWITIPTDQTIEEGESFSYQLGATDLSGISAWAVNDTDHFSISSDGLITNATTLSPGVYGLSIEVWDNNDNSLWISISITVTEHSTTTSSTTTTTTSTTTTGTTTSDTTPTDLPVVTLILVILGVGGALVAVVVVVIIKKRKP